MTRPFHFQQFSIYQDRCAMKVGFDAVLLGAWADASGARRILDIGAGSGVITLMLAQRQPAAQFVAVEIDAAAAGQARENVARTSWAERITVLQKPIQEHTAVPYDLIVSNPPFFTGRGTPSPDPARRRAREEPSLSAAELLSAAVRLLGQDGRLALIWPFGAGDALIELAAHSDLHLRRRITVFPNPEKAPHRLLLEFGRGERPLCTGTITIETAQHHLYTPEFTALTADFYL